MQRIILFYSLHAFQVLKYCYIIIQLYAYRVLKLSHVGLHSYTKLATATVATSTLIIYFFKLYDHLHCNRSDLVDICAVRVHCRSHVCLTCVRNAF